MGLKNLDVETLKNDRDVEGLVKLLTDDDRSVRENAVSALGDLGDVSCALPLAQRLQDDYLDIRIATCASLIKMGNQVVEPLIQVLKDENCIVREGAVQALEKLRDSRAIYPLIEAFKDTNRKRISDALRSIGSASFFPLIDTLKNEDSRIRVGAAKTLGDMKNPEALDPLFKATKDNVPAVREYARAAIYMIKRHNIKRNQVQSKTK